MIISKAPAYAEFSEELHALVVPVTRYCSFCRCWSLFATKPTTRRRNSARSIKSSFSHIITIKNSVRRTRAQEICKVVLSPSFPSSQMLGGTFYYPLRIRPRRVVGQAFPNIDHAFLYLVSREYPAQQGRSPT